MVLTQNQKRFYPICKNATWGNSSCCPKLCWVIHLCYPWTWTMAT